MQCNNTIQFQRLVYAIKQSCCFTLQQGADFPFLSGCKSVFLLSLCSFHCSFLPQSEPSNPFRGPGKSSKLLWRGQGPKLRPNTLLVFSAKQISIKRDNSFKLTMTKTTLLWLVLLSVSHPLSLCSGFSCTRCLQEVGAFVARPQTRNSSGDEIANVNFLRLHRTRIYFYALRPGSY